MPSTAVAPANTTEATSRKAAAIAEAPDAPVVDVAATAKYAHRQAKSYKNEDLKPFTVPDLTIKDLLSAIPKHCFERSTFKSSLHLAADFAIVAALGFAASFIDPTVRSFDFAAKSPLSSYISPALQASAARFAAWAVYSVAQGLVLTGIWVIAHECGHQAFSPSKTINNSVGWVLHSALLVPYHSWRISHARHHAATGHLTRDEVFVPRTRAQKGLLPLRPADATASDLEDEQVVDETLQSSKAAKGSSAATDAANVEEEEESFGEWLAELLEDAPAYNFIYLIVQQLFGWPLYLLKNSSGQTHFPKGTNHFNPESIIFDKRHRSQIIVSDIGIALTLAALAFAASVTSAGAVIRYYGIPYLWVNHWLVMITYLQHTDPMLPHYNAESWTFPRGALCTIDRKWLGPVGPYLLHGIAETHVAHHISSKIPHYNAWEATEALKERLGEHYQCCDENVFVSLWNTVRNCKHIGENEQVSFYRNAHGVPQRFALEKEPASDSGVALSDE